MNIRILSGSALKVIAVLSMFCDHTAKYILASFPFAWKPFFVIKGVKVSLYFLMTSVIGRIAFPLFAFLVVEGYLHTRDLKKYMLNMAIFAVLTIVPWNMLRGSWCSFHSFNVLFTFLLGLSAIYAVDKIARSGNGTKAFLVVSASLAAAYLLHTDYGFIGILTMLLFYALAPGRDVSDMTLTRAGREYQSLVPIACIFRGKMSIGAPLAAIPILMYNGNRGFIRGKAGKYIFYAIYPLHLIIILIIRNCLIH